MFVIYLRFELDIKNLICLHSLQKPKKPCQLTCKSWEQKALIHFCMLGNDELL